ncbi:MAG: flagellar biosynthesis regulator FlaF [Candidatus Liberibacter ctenarytainae]|uniref:Flagellar biosynthesis regulator FlaF n=1 Tax=Candidatus Liberibacter ctenarytainae TaxID=2020335 RepID=A0A937DLK0_9HYPH|nr:flagellar biosynthesis regulator FlaF [Candidatus Liberibacter ctenarytainae]
MHHCYDESIKESFSESRNRERIILDKSISLLSNARHCEQDNREIIESLSYTTRIWTVFIQDLISENNQLPEDLKLNLISIGLWIIEECARIRRNESNNYQGIIDLISLIRDGLR